MLQSLTLIENNLLKSQQTESKIIKSKGITVDVDNGDNINNLDQEKHNRNRIR